MKNAPPFAGVNVSRLSCVKSSEKLLKNSSNFAENSGELLSVKNFINVDEIIY